MDAAAGWYADPWGNATWRWWNGYEWTAHTHTAQPDPTPAPVPAEPAPSSPGFLRRTASGIRDRREAARAAEEASRAGEKAAAEARREKHRRHKRRIAGTWLQYPTLQPAGWDRSAWQPVVGESHYQPALELAAEGRCEEGPVQCLVIAQLVAEPQNEHDPNAIQVRVDGNCVGYIPRDETYRFHPFLGVFSEEIGEVATCRAWIKGGWQRGQARGTFGIDLDIRFDLDGGVSAFHPDDEGFLPCGFDVSVVGEEQCQDTLARLGVGSRFVVELVESDQDPFRPKAKGPLVLVMAGGEQVGALTPKMSARYLPLIRDVAAAGYPCTCSAYVEEGSKKLEVKVGAVSPAKISNAYES